MAKSQELTGVTISFGWKHSGVVVYSTPLRPLEPYTTVLALGCWSQGVELLL